MCPAPPTPPITPLNPWPWADPGLSQDGCPLCHASPCWLWSGDCRYNVDCSQSVFKDQNNNGICSAHSLTLIDHLVSLSLRLWSHQLCLETFPDTSFTLKNKPTFTRDLWCKKKKKTIAGALLGGEALVWWCGELCDSSGLMQCGRTVLASIANFCLKASSLRRLANQL